MLHSECDDYFENRNARNPVGGATGLRYTRRSVGGICFCDTLNTEKQKSHSEGLRPAARRKEHFSIINELKLTNFCIYRGEYEVKGE